MAGRAELSRFHAFTPKEARLAPAAAAVRIFHQDLRLPAGDSAERKSLPVRQRIRDAGIQTKGAVDTAGHFQGEAKDLRVVSPHDRFRRTDPNTGLTAVTLDLVEEELCTGALGVVGDVLLPDPQLLEDVGKQPMTTRDQ